MSKTKDRRRAAQARKAARPIEAWDVVWTVKADWNHKRPRPHVVLEVADDQVYLMPMSSSVERGPVMAATRSNSLDVASYCAPTTTVKGGVEEDARYWAAASSVSRKGKLDACEISMVRHEVEARTRGM